MIRLEDEAELAAIVQDALDRPLDAHRVHLLALKLADSGARYAHCSGSVADVASTGGPGSLTTLLCPLFLVAKGFVVAKLGVPGRPAGAIDTLATIAGFKDSLGLREVGECIARSGIAHTLAGDAFAPLDASLFNYRQRAGAQRAPGLVAASILAKKLALGVDKVGLDVRVGSHGNFGTRIPEAMENARLFCDAANLAGIEAVVFLSHPDVIPQPWIGRGESLVALGTALGILELPSCDSWLAEHVADCERMVDFVSALPKPACDAIAENTESDTRYQARRAFDEHLSAQGASMSAFRARVDEVLAASTCDIEALDDGAVRIDVESLRQVLVGVQAADHSTRFADTIGVKLLERPGAIVAKGTRLAVLRRTGSLSTDERLFALIAGCFSVEKVRAAAADAQQCRLGTSIAEIICAQ